MNDVLKDTIFTKDLHISPSTDGLHQVESSTDTTVDKKKIHLYEEINDLQHIFDKDETYIPIVKLRTDSAASSGSDINQTPENLRQKIIRRLSFSAKDKSKSLPFILKKAKEAEDCNLGFEIIEPAEIIEIPKKHNTTNTMNNMWKPSPFAGFFNTLHRRGSKRETPKSN